MNPYYINITKNSGNQTVLSDLQIAENFVTSIPRVCPVTSYEFVFPQISQNLPKAFIEGEDGILYTSTSLPSDDLMEFTWNAAEITASTDYNKTGTFDVVATVGCFFETTITKNLEPYSEAYDIAIALPVASVDDPNRIKDIDVGIRLFQTDIDKCYASTLLLCEDETCQTLATSSAVRFTANPTSKNATGFHDAVLQVDRSVTDTNLDVFIMGTTLDPNVNATIKARIAVCGERYLFSADDADSQLTTELTAPDLVNEIKTVDLLELFAFAIPSSVFPTEACIVDISLCNADGSECLLNQQFADQLLLDIDRDLGQFNLVIRQDASQAPLEAAVGIL
jgi:hypothetical protein